MDEVPFTGRLAAELQKPRHEPMTLYWLGQAGFVIDLPQYRVAIDPYLSDSLAMKYRGTAFPHQRMMPAPVTPEELGQVDLVLCTHHHADHMDGATLAPLARRLPDLRFVVPAASLGLAAERIGVTAGRLIPLDAGEAVSVLPGLCVQAFRAAHETLERDARGHHRFLGYGLEAGSHRLFHSGDTVAFAGQAEELADFAPDVTLLPVNGRSPELRAAGFAGNLSLDEAVALCERCAIPAMIAHHYGMFAFNTADPSAIDQAARKAPFQMTRARLQVAFYMGLR